MMDNDGNGGGGFRYDDRGSIVFVCRSGWVVPQKNRDRSGWPFFTDGDRYAKQTSRVHPAVHKRVSDCLQSESLSILILEFAGQS